MTSRVERGAESAKHYNKNRANNSLTKNRKVFTDGILITIAGRYLM